MPQPVTLPAGLTGDLEVTGVRSVQGGSISQVFQGQSKDGPVFLKMRPSAPEDFYAREAAGLRALHGTGTIPVPTVLRESASGLVLSWIDHDRPGQVESRALGAEAFGRGLADLHAHTGPYFGSIDETPHGYLGLVALDLTPQRDWPTAYLERRLLPWGRAAVDAHRLDPAAVPLIERLIDRGQDVCGVPEPPSMVHGDLWSGNSVVAEDGRHWLVDPSAHFGHREVDLALMRLLGGFPEATFAAYMEVFPLAQGWQRRTDLYQLAPLLANTLMRGGSYGSQVMERLRRLI